MRDVAVFTSSRADLGPLGPVIAALDVADAVRLTVVATGTHGSEQFGGRLADIRLSSRNRVHIIDPALAGTNPSNLGEAFGRIGAGVSDLFDGQSVDVLVLLGDRWELLAAAGAALLHGVTIAHLHGGETTEGAIDERIRHGITKLADLHLCATSDSARRIRRLGEEPRRIFVTGAPGLDRLHAVEPMTDGDLGVLLGMPIVRPFGVVVFHPPTVDRRSVTRQARDVFEAAAATLGTAVLLYPGADPGADDVVAEIARATTLHPHLVAARNLGESFVPMLASADIQVGNSSSGIIEAASLCLPVVDVGDRQAGRLHARNVVHVVGDAEQIAQAIVRSLVPSRRADLTDLTNPYGDGRAGERIAEILATVELHGLSRKPLTSADDVDAPLDALCISKCSTLRDALAAIDRGRHQIALVVNDSGGLIGTVSDGDVRRAVLAGINLDESVDDHMNVTPVVATVDDDDRTVLASMDRHAISQIPVLDRSGRAVELRTMRSILSRIAFPSTDGGHDDVPPRHLNAAG